MPYILHFTHGWLMFNPSKSVEVKGGNHGKRGQEATKEDEETQTQKATGPGSP